MVGTTAVRDLDSDRLHERVQESDGEPDGTRAKVVMPGRELDTRLPGHKGLHGCSRNRVTLAGGVWTIAVGYYTNGDAVGKPGLDVRTFPWSERWVSPVVRTLGKSMKWEMAPCGGMIIVSAARRGRLHGVRVVLNLDMKGRSLRPRSVMPDYPTAH